MSSQSCFGDTQPSSLTKPLDILNLLRDENFPKLPSFVPLQNKKESIQTKPRIQMPEDFCEDAYENPAYVTPRKPSKKKGVVFSQELEQHCSISPSKMDLDQIRVNLNKRAKKGILIRKPGLLSSSNVSESTKPSLSNAQGILSLSSVTSLAFDADASKEPSRSMTKTSTPSHYQNEKKNKEAVMPSSIEIMALDASDASSISIEDEVIENKIESNNEKIISNKPPMPVRRDGMATSNSGNLRTFQSQLKAQLSFSAMVPPIEPPQLKKNQSAILESGNDISSVQSNSMTSKASKLLGSEAKISSEFEKGRRRLVLSKSARGSQLQLSNPPQRDSYQRDSYRGDNNTQKPVPKTLKIPLVEPIHKIIPVNNSDVRKIQTPSNSRIVIKTTNLPSTPSSHQIRAKIVVSHDKTHKDGEHANTNFSSSYREALNLNTNSTTNIGLIQDINNKRASSDTFFVKKGSQIIHYSLKEGHYKTFEYEQSLFLDGSAFCKANNDTLIVTGGADSKSKLVSSKATLINLATNDKEILPGMPIARYNHGITLHNGKNLYTIGGQSFEGKVLKSCYMLELGNKTWSRIPSLKYERANPLVFTSAKTGNLYVIGGTDSEGNEVPWVEKLDIQKQTWQLVYNAARFDLCSKDMIVLGSFNNNRSSDTSTKLEETLILVKDSVSKNGGGKYLLLSFDTENEILTKRGDFQYETTNSGAFGFVNGNNIYFTEKSRSNMLDVYILDSQIWAHKRLKQVS